MVKFTNLISKEEENSKCYVKYVFWKIFKNSIKLFCKKGVLRNFTKFTVKQLCRVSFLIKLQACNFIEKETPPQVFSCEFFEISKNIFFTEQLWATASAGLIHWKLPSLFLIHPENWVNFEKNFNFWCFQGGIKK